MAATSCCVFIGMQCRNATHNAFAKMMFSSAALWNQIAAAPGSQHTSQICAGLSQWNLAVSDVLSFSLNTQGQGARSSKDGMDAYGFAWCAFGRAPDSEQVESELPVTVTLSQHWKDSSGHGLHRGGSGGVQHWMIHKIPELVSMCMGNGSKVPLGQPLFGGYASSPIPGISIRKADLLKQMADANPALTLDFRAILEDHTIQGNWTMELVARTPKVYDEGDLLFGFSGGGPGYGDPLERDPEELLEDLKKNIISDWTAQNIYHIAYDPARHKLDPEKTKQLRDEERQARLARGKTFDEFEKAWTKKPPPKEILQYYGPWPDAKSTGPIFRPIITPKQCDPGGLLHEPRRQQSRRAHSASRTSRRRAPPPLYSLPIPLFLPILFNLGAKIENTPLPAYLTNPTKISNAQRQIRTRLRSDGVACYFDPHLEAEALGAFIDWPATRPPSPLPHIDNWPIQNLRSPEEAAKHPRVTVAAEVIHRLKSLLRDEPLLLAGVTGPFTLAAQLAQQAGRESINREDLPDTAVELAAATITQIATN